MSRLIAILIIFCAFRAMAADRITATIAVTNAPIGNTNTLTINGTTRTFTNSVTGSPGTLIQETNSIPWSATNILTQLTTYRVSQFHFLGSSATTNVRVTGAVGENLTVSLAGFWGTVTYTTQSVSSPTFVVRVPMTVEQTSNRTHIASLLVVGQSDNSTNSFATNAVAMSNYLTRGASPLQTIAGPVQLFGRVSINSNFFATNGFTSSLTNINPVTSNLVNYGNAIRSESVGGNSLAVGSNAVAWSLRTMAIGNGALATNTDAMAIGTGAKATNGNSAAIGIGAEAWDTSGLALGAYAIAKGLQGLSIGTGASSSNDNSMAVGTAATANEGSMAIGNTAEANGTNAVAFGPAAVASGNYGMAIGYGSTASSFNSSAIGAGSIAQHNFSTALGGYDFSGSVVTTTDTNQIRIGTANHSVSVPGRIESPTITNATILGVTTMGARLDLTSRANTALANGNNSAVVLGTNTYVRLSGPTAGYTLNGIAAETDGSWHIAEFVNPVNSFTVANQSGTDPTAANRIVTGTGGDVTFTNNPVVLQFIYNASDARWKVVNWFR